MKVLVVYCHPMPESFCAAVRDAVLASLQTAGHETRLVDLYGENFNPVMPVDERRRYQDGPPGDPGLAPHVERLVWAEALVFVYPTWWYGLPAMLKGWLDRVVATDVAFTLPPDGGTIRPLLTRIRYIAVVTTCGAPRWLSFLMGQPGRKTILRGIRAICAKRCRTIFLAHYAMDVSTPQSRSRFLDRVARRFAALR
jgi:NAD(P)H dehydrogenase (quinone)